MDGTFGLQEPQLIGCQSGYSFYFDLIGKDWVSLNYHPMHRVCSLMRKLGVTHLCREELALSTELQNEKADLETRTGGQVDFKSIRFSFFRVLDSGQPDWRNVRDDHLLGYAVVVTFRPHAQTQAKSYMFEAVVRPPTIWNAQGEAHPVSNYFVRGQKKFSTVIGASTDSVPLQIQGSFFCQQNGLTHVCAHAALRTAINSSPSYAGEKITTKRINDILGKDHAAPDRIVGRHINEVQFIGLRVDQIIDVARNCGFSPHAAEFNQTPLVEYEEYLYPLVESGMPTILGLHPKSIAHVVAVVGHTFNSDRWLPDARQGYNVVPYETKYASAAAWTDHFIVSDDNLGAMVTLPTDSIRNILIPKYNAGLHASLAIGLAPANIGIPGYSVEKSAVDVFTHLFEKNLGSVVTNRWISYMRTIPHTIPRVCRTTLQEKSEYLSAMREAADEDGNQLTANELAFIESQLTCDKFWVTEFSLSNLFTGNKRKLGDVVCAASCTSEQFAQMEGFMLAWAPGRLWHKDGGTHLSRIDATWSLRGHVSLLGRQSNNRSPLEW